uniref:Uncharacterized protein n=1 Tax=Serratia marcescens TaxID=615 RepID=A0A1C3HH65_SERMA|nr:Uncharacterised protein [Serratia marcescens]
MIGSSSLVTLAKKLKCDINWLLNEDVGERQIVDNNNNNDEGTPSIIQFNPFPSESNEADKPLEDAVDFLGRLYRELDKQRRIELLRHAVSMWRESVNETLAKYEKNNDS